MELDELGNLRGSAVRNGFAPHDLEARTDSLSKFVTPCHPTNTVSQAALRHTVVAATTDVTVVECVGEDGWVSAWVGAERGCGEVAGSERPLIDSPYHMQRNVSLVLIGNVGFERL